MSNQQQSRRLQDYINQFHDFNDFDNLKQNETIKVYERMTTDLPWNITTEEEKNQQQQQTMTDPILSRKTNQITTNITTDHPIRCNLMKYIQDDIENIPHYLTKHNQSFQQMFNQLQLNIPTTTTTTINNNTYNKDTIRKIAIFIYQIMILNHYHLLWTAYLKSGLGKLIKPSNEVSKVFYAKTIPIWPKEIKILVSSSSSNTNINKKNENEIYFNFINQQLNELDHQLKIYHNQLHIGTNYIHGYTFDIQKMIETYIEQNLQSFHMKIEHEIELVHFDYHIQALKLEYLRHNPNSFQEQLMKDVCQSKYEQETTEQEYQFLIKQINYYSNSPDQTFESSPLGQSTTRQLMDLIENTDLHQQFFQQFKTIAEKSRNDMFEINIKFADEERQQYQKKYEDNIKKMWSAHRRLPSIDRNHIISQVMIELIIERCKKITERIQCIYQFKAKNFFDKFTKL